MGFERGFIHISIEYKTIASYVSSLESRTRPLRVVEITDVEARGRSTWVANAAWPYPVATSRDTVRRILARIHGANTRGQVL